MHTPKLIGARPHRTTQACIRSVDVLCLVFPTIDRGHVADYMQDIIDAGLEDAHGAVTVTADGVITAFEMHSVPA